MCQEGHKVIVLMDLMGKEWANLTDKPVSDFAKSAPCDFEYKELVKLRGFWRRILFAKREIVNYMAYQRSENPLSESPYHRARAVQFLPERFKRAVSYKPLYKLMINGLTGKFWEKLEKLAPVDSEIKSELENYKPDLIVASPYLLQRSEHIDYAKCADALGIPFVAAMAGWDNLTTKGVVQVKPDYFFVWNKKHVKELKEIHDYDSGRAIYTGAPPLDIWLDKKPSVSYERFCANTGLNPDLPFITYLCSSKNIAKDEDVFIEKMIEHFRAITGAPEFSILVRPHPENMKIWRERRVSGTVLSPETYPAYYSKDAKNHYFDTMYYSSCVVAINTTAILEAALLGKPCISLVTDHYQATQIKTKHFNLLLNADFLLIANNFDDAIEYIKGAIRGDDPRRNERRRFVESFIRPWGMGVSASELMGKALEDIANGVSVNDIYKKLSQTQDKHEANHSVDLKKISL